MYSKFESYNHILALVEHFVMRILGWSSEDILVVLCRKAMSASNKEQHQALFEEVCMELMRYQWVYASWLLYINENIMSRSVDS